MLTALIHKSQCNAKGYVLGLGFEKTQSLEKKKLKSTQHKSSIT